MPLWLFLIVLLATINLLAFAALRDQSLKNRRMRRISRAFICVEFVNFLWWLTGADFTQRGWPLAASVLTLVLGAAIAYHYEENP